jgi:hypothetical protein
VTGLTYNVSALEFVRLNLNPHPAPFRHPPAY